MERLWIADGHCDSLGDLTLRKRDLSGQTEQGHWDLVKAREAGIGLQFFAAYIESEYKPFLATQRGLEHLETALNFIDNNTKIYLIRDRSDLIHLGESGTIGLLLTVEGGEIIGENLFMLDILYRLGVRGIGLTWNQRNAIADGAGELKSKGGLSCFGFEVLAKMNSLGMLIDVSHLNEPGFWDVISNSKKPVVASHSCARALCDHPRNLNDAQLRALAEKKGVVGVNFCQDFLNSTGRATIDDVVRHICHIAEIAGVDTVGFGSDFDGIPSTPKGLEDATKFPVLLKKLKECGFTQAELKKICHGNFVRVLDNVLK